MTWRFLLTAPLWRACWEPPADCTVIVCCLRGLALLNASPAGKQIPCVLAYSTISLIDFSLLLNDLIKFDCNYLRGKLLFSIRMQFTPVLLFIRATISGLLGVTKPLCHSYKELSLCINLIYRNNQDKQQQETDSTPDKSESRTDSKKAAAFRDSQ